MELLKLYIDDGFIFWLINLNFQSFKACLNSIYPSIKLTFEKPENVYENQKKV